MSPLDLRVPELGILEADISSLVLKHGKATDFGSESTETGVFLPFSLGFLARHDECATKASGFSRKTYLLRTAPYFPAFTSSSAISRSLNFCTFMEGVMGKSSTKNTRLGTL